MRDSIFARWWNDPELSAFIEGKARRAWNPEDRKDCRQAAWAAIAAAPDNAHLESLTDVAELCVDSELNQVAKKPARLWARLRDLKGG